MSALEWFVLIALFAATGVLIAAVRGETQRQAEMNRAILLRLEENIQSLQDRLIGIERMTDHYNARVETYDSESFPPAPPLSVDWPFKR